MKLPWKMRTSLFVRMSMLFGLLVTVPLVISGIVLSLTGWKSVRQSGMDVAGIGIAAVSQSFEGFKDVARNRLTQTGERVAEHGSKRLQETSDRAREVGTKGLKKNTELMSRRSQQAVTETTQKMVQVGQEKLEHSLTQLRALNKDSLNDLNSRFIKRMESELAVSSDPILKKLEEDLIASWQLSAGRNALAVQDAAVTAGSQIRLRLYYPLATIAVVRGEEKEAGELLEQHVRAVPNPQVVRVVLVTRHGTEVVRVPASDLPQGEDWEHSATRKRLFSQTNPAITEPVQYDERSKQWIVRVAHQVSGSEAASEAAQAAAMAADPAAQRDPTSFVVVDFSLADLVRDAISAEAAPGRQALVVHAETGRVVSSRDPKDINGLAQRIVDQLPKDAEAEKYQLKPFFFRYTVADGTVMLASATFWRKEDGAWTVVAQSENDVRAPAAVLQRSIQLAWKNSLRKARDEAQGVVQERSGHAERIQRRLVGESKQVLNAQQNSLRENVRSDLLRYQGGLVKELQKELKTEVDALREKGAAGMRAEASGLTRDAVDNLSLAAATETRQAGRDITARANEVANRHAEQMITSSAWLIPLFLVLALLLATLTARSLVRPINRLVGGTQALAAGQYNQRIKVQGDDELARLALAFNEMAWAIERGQAELLQSHDSLSAEKARIEAIVDSSPDGLVMLEPGGQVAFINPAAVRLLDLSPREIPHAPFELAQLPPEAAHSLEECLRLVRDADGPQLYEISEPQRSVLQLRAVQLRAQGGRGCGRLLHLHDITRERIIDEMKSDFISLVSHELRTPLTSILGFSSYMLTGRLGAVQETQKTALESIHRQARRLSAIISDFLDVSRIESGKIEMKKEPVSMPGVAGRVIEDLRPQAGEKSIQVSTQYDDSALPLTALGDEQRIAQVLTNLLGNALKFTDSQGAIDVSVSRQNGEVLCQIRDTGCGIPPDELDRVFDRFYQVEKVVTRKSGGTGLGLAIVKNIVEAHGGKIWIESEVGRGTEVNFTLPGSE